MGPLNIKMKFDKILESIDYKKDIVILGGSGSGKTELALNMAVLLSKKIKDRRVNLFDMDQTKPLFRARTHEEELEKYGVVLHYQEQLLDLPTQVAGVRESFFDEHSVSILDIGGNENGARMIGQFADIINSENATILYVINPYRAWSGSRENIIDSMEKIMKAGRVNSVKCVCNPAFGNETRPEDVTQGVEKLQKSMGLTPALVTMQEKNTSEVEKEFEIPVLPLRLFIKCPWDEE